MGDGKEHGENPAWDAAEAEALYDLLEHEVIPEFYNRNQEGIPTAWVAHTRLRWADWIRWCSRVASVKTHQ
ncbi:MAG: hypothetical protein Q8L62_09155 [Candidatus Nitrotoga sp.]|nr:hypothetical protein [Candidatus Nitrotoga sp.]